MRVNSMDAVGSTGNNIKNQYEQVSKKEAAEETKGQVKKQGDGKGLSLFAGDLNIISDPIEEKRKDAREQALKIVKDAWESDRAVDESIESRRENLEKMRELEKESGKELERINLEKDALKEEYQIESGSQEQMDLELLQRRQDKQNGDSDIRFTEEELERLAEIDERGVTEYQQRALELNDQAYWVRSDLKEAQKQIKDDVADIRAIKIERLKTHGMVDAQKSADSIMKAASDEIEGMLVMDAKENIDEKQEEEEEKAKEEKEKDEKEEERLEELEEKRVIQEALIAKTEEAVEKLKAKQKKDDMPEIDMDDMLDISQGNASSAEVQKGLQSIKDSMNLLEADLKGIKVDEEV